MSQGYPRHIGENNLANIRVIKQKGKIVSHVATSIRPVTLGGIHTRVAGIGAVATAPSARGQGFASILMGDAVRRSIEQGADIMLISGDENIYLRMNATCCGRFSEVRVSRKQLGNSELISIKPATADDLDAIIPLRQQLPIRYLFPREDLHALLQCQLAMDKPVDWWVAQYGGKVAGWAVVHQKENVLYLIDWAGSPDVLEQTAGLLADQYQTDTFVYTAPHENMLPIQWLPLIHETRTFDGTVLILDARRLLERAQEFLVERAGEETCNRLEINAEEQEVEFFWDEQRISFDNSEELALLFFGHPERNILNEKLKPESELYQVLQGIFPMPLVWYGIGYV